MDEVVFDKTRTCNDKINLSLNWDNEILNSKIINNSDYDVRIKEIILLKGKAFYTHDTPLYGEGYNMLSQYEGTIAEEKNVTCFTDWDHYKLPKKQGFRTVYNLALLTLKTKFVLMAFTSCKRFNGEFRFNENEYQVVLNTENKILHKGECWDLEQLIFTEGNDKNKLFDKLSKRINKNQPKLKFDEVPVGWCSWYCFGPEVTEKNIIDNLEIASKKLPQLKYIQIDDGYQPFMGDWLEDNPNYKFSVKNICEQISKRGFVPAIWVAPFIAEKDSKIFKQHHDWFIKDDNKLPLAADKISFGGWRCGPWYMLDATNPQVREHFIKIFRTLREEWGCRYFKLDANMWGALPGGIRYDNNATKVEAYRMGMEAILEGAGKDSFILGCNAPMWPSIGVVHGMRVSGDIVRSKDCFVQLAKEIFYRNWQHNNLWINDPDCVVLQNVPVNIVGPDGKMVSSSTDINSDEFIFHASVILASGGMVLSGDDLTKLSKNNKKILEKLLPPLNKSAQFLDGKFEVSKIELDEYDLLFAFNCNDNYKNIELDVTKYNKIVDFWNDREIKVNDDILLCRLQPISAQVYTCYKK